MLAAYPATRIVLVLREGDEARWAEKDLFEKAVARFDRPVHRVAVADGSSAARARVAGVRSASAAGGRRSELRPSRNFPPLPVADAAALAVGIVGTIVLVVLAALSPGPFLTWPGSAQLGIAIYSALVNLGQIVGLVLMAAVGFDRFPERLFAWLTLIGTPIAIAASLVLLAIG